MTAPANPYRTPVGVYLRLDDRAEYHLGDVYADRDGRIRPEELVTFFRAVAGYMHSRFLRERREAQQGTQP
jgi:hypothetical protein